jgi:hypothetical protein
LKNSTTAALATFYGALNYDFVRNIFWAIGYAFVTYVISGTGRSAGFSPLRMPAA